MNEQLEKDIRAEIDKVRELKQDVGDINNHLSIIESLCRLDAEALKQKADKSYQRGLDDAWEAARKIADMWTRMGNDEILAIFGITERIGNSTINSLFGKQTVNEAMLKLEAYEEKQKADDEIKVGDEVIYNGLIRCVVVAPETNKRYASLFDCNGNHYSADHQVCMKTGRHFDIEKILEEMRC